MVTLNYALGQSSLPLSILGVTPGIIIATMMMKYCNKSVIATVYKKQSDDAIERYRFQHLTHK